MKTLTSSKGAMFTALIALVATACDTASTSPELQWDQSAHETVLAGGTSVTGAAQFTNAQGLYRRMEITASRDVSGIATGMLQWVAGAAIIKGRITCLTTQGNMAWIGGIVEHAFFTPVPPGSEFTMVVVDNGEGQDVRDQTTGSPFLKPTGSAATFCSSTPAPSTLLSMDHGNIQIRN